MLTTKTNFHRSKLPSVGAVVTLAVSSIAHPKRKFRVTAYPLSDNVLPYSVGIHTCYLQALDNGQQIRVSGFYCKPVNGY